MFWLHISLRLGPYEIPSKQNKCLKNILLFMMVSWAKAQGKGLRINEPFPEIFLEGST